MRARAIPWPWRAVALCLIGLWLGIGLHGVAHALEHDCAALCVICFVVTGVLHAVVVTAPLLAHAPARAMGHLLGLATCPHPGPRGLGANFVRGPPCIS